MIIDNAKNSLKRIEIITNHLISASKKGDKSVNKTIEELACIPVETFTFLVKDVLPALDDLEKKRR